MIQGASGTTLISAQLTEGTGQSVSFGVSGLPGGAAASFDPTSCNPPCSTQLTISTSSGTPTGTFPITVSGVPLGGTTVFDLVVNFGCAVITALGEAPDQRAKLAVFYEFRDRVLARTPAGQRYVSLFYKHAAESVLLMLRYPELRSRSRALIERVLPTLRAILALQPAMLSAADLASIESLLGAFTNNARAGLRADIDAIRQELRMISLDGRRR